MTALGGGHPPHLDPAGVDADVLEQVLHQGEPAPGEEISLGIMTVTGMASPDEHAVRSLLQRIHDEQRVYPAGAHHPYDFHIRGIFHPAGARKVRARIGAPVVQKSDDIWL